MIDFDRAHSFVSCECRDREWADGRVGLMLVPWLAAGLAKKGMPLGEAGLKIINCMSLSRLAHHTEAISRADL